MTDPTQLPNFPSGDEQPPAGLQGAAGPSLKEQVLQLLRTDGMNPQVDGDGDVSFDVQGQTMFVRVTEGDIDIMRVFGQWQIGADVPQDTLRWLNNTNDVTLGANVVKLGIVGTTLVVSGEHIMLKGDSPSPRLQLTVNMIMQAVQIWHENVMKDEVEHATAAAIGSRPPAGEQAAAPQGGEATGGQRGGSSSASLNLGSADAQEGRA